MIAWAKMAENARPKRGGPQNGPLFVRALADLATKLGWDPDWLFTHVRMESGFQTDAQNPTAAGLFQWTVPTINAQVRAGRWPAGVTREFIIGAPWPIQLALAEAYLRPIAHQVTSVGDLRLTQWGFPANAPRGAILFAADGRSAYLTPERSRAAYANNVHSDVNGDGLFTSDEVRDGAERFMAMGKNEKWSGNPTTPAPGLGLLWGFIGLGLAGVAGWYLYPKVRRWI
jgi:hypothetical protein